MISVSIIVLAWNEEKTLEATLESLLEMDYEKKKCEIIVVAGGSDDTHETALEMSRAIGTFSRYLVIVQKPFGKNAAIQQGLDEANNDVIVLLDADTIVSRRWLLCMVEITD